MTLHFLQPAQTIKPLFQEGIIALSICLLHLNQIQCSGTSLLLENAPQVRRFVFFEKFHPHTEFGKICQAFDKFIALMYRDSSSAGKVNI